MDEQSRWLARLRIGIDAFDDALLLCLAGRRRLVAAASRVKQRGGIPVRDPDRERRIVARGQSLARRLGLPPRLAQDQMALVIADGCRLQGLSPDPGQGAEGSPAGNLAPTMNAPEYRPPSLSRALLRALPPPARWAPLLRRLPPAWPGRLVEPAVAHLLAAPLGAGGMGQVWRATDNLDRQVALKVLPPELAHVPDRMARFERKHPDLVGRIPNPRARIDILHNLVEEHGEFKEESFHQNTFQH